MHVLLLGASRNVGYFVTQRLLVHGHTCTLILRQTEAIESDSSLSSYIGNGKLKLVRGDALVEADVQQAWNTAKNGGEVDAVFFGIGATTAKFSITKGFIAKPITDLTARCMSILLAVIQKSTTLETRPKLVTITSNGLDQTTRPLLPLPLKLVMYGWLLHGVHEDKVLQENAVKSAAGWEEGSEGWLGAQNLVIVRPSLFMFTSDVCEADKKPNAYRTGEGLKSAWTISRPDCAHFIAEKILEDWETWAGKAWVVSY